MWTDITDDRLILQNCCITGCFKIFGKYEKTDLNEKMVINCHLVRAIHCFTKTTNDRE